MKNKFLYNKEELSSVERNLNNAAGSIQLAYNHLDSIYNLDKEIAINTWNNDSSLKQWLGKAESYAHIRKAWRRLSKMNRLLDRKINLVLDSDKSRLCKGTRHAWTIPKARLSIHLCPQYMYKSDKHRTKILIHELAHESGILFHQRVYWRSAALRTAREKPDIALKNPENFAFYIISYYDLAKSEGRDKYFYK